MSNATPRQDRPINRREALKIGAAAAGLGAAGWVLQHTSPTGLVDDFTGLTPAFARSAQQGEAIVRTTCALCPSGCGLEVRVIDGRATKVEGNALHPLNQGVCCLRGQCALEVLYSPERLAHPRIQRGKRGSGDWEEVSWDEAVAYVADKLSKVRQAGPHGLALVHGELRGQMRSLAGRFMQAFGSPNLVGRDSLAENAVRQAMFLSQGINGLPAYDINNAAYVMAFGGNPLETSRSVIVNLGAVAFMRRGRPQRGKFVSVHPRLTLSGAKADEWIPIRPGAEGALALGMANVIINSGLYDAPFVHNFTFGFDDFTDAQGETHTGFKTLVLEQYTLERVSHITGIAAEIIARLAGEFAANRPAVALMPAEAGELTGGNALYTALAIHSLNALVGSIDAKGGVMVQRFPKLAAWPAFSNDAAGQAGLAQPRLDGAGAQALPLPASVYQNLPQALRTGQPYPLQALLLLNANPVYDLSGDGMAEALDKVPFIVSLAPTLDESAALADVVLPASTFLESWGDDFMEGVGYAGVSLRRPVVEPVHDTRDPGDALLALAAALGGPLAAALPFSDYRQAVMHRLSGAPIDTEKLESNGFWGELVYFNAAPGSPAWSQVVGRDRLNAPQDGRFDFFSRELFSLFGDRRGPAADLACLPHFELPTAAQEVNAQDYPFLLLSQSLITISPSWQGVIPTLQEALGLQGHVKWESWVEMNAHAAEALHIADGDIVWVESTANRVKARARLTPGMWPNAVFLPAGLGHHTLVKWGRGAESAAIIGVNPSRLSPHATEPVSGQAVIFPLRVKVYKAWEER